MHVRDRSLFQPLTDAAEVIAVGARLDAGAANRMREHFRRLVAADRRRQIVDLTGIVVLDSGGLAGLVAALRAVRETGVEVELVAGAGHVKQILELTALTKVFRVHRSLSAALASS